LDKWNVETGLILDRDYDSMISYVEDMKAIKVVKHDTKGEDYGFKGEEFGMKGEYGVGGAYKRK
jgi:hypothetical protein